jgi:hypothetical protein
VEGDRFTFYRAIWPSNFFTWYYGNRRWHISESYMESRFHLT